MLKSAILWSVLITKCFTELPLKHNARDQEEDNVCIAKANGERAQALVQVRKGMLVAKQQLVVHESKQAPVLDEQRGVDESTKNDTGASHLPSHQDKESLDVCSLTDGANATYVHRDMPCPEQCPFSQISAGNLCIKICLAQCAVGDSLTADGKCVKGTMTVRSWIQVGGLCATILIAIYLVGVTIRTVSSERRLQLSLEYALHPDSCDSSLALHEAVSGIGTILYLRWLLFLIAMVVICFSTSCASFNFSLHPWHVGEILKNEACPVWPPKPHAKNDTVLAQTNATATKYSHHSGAQEHPKMPLEMKIHHSVKPWLRYDDERPSQVEHEYNERMFHALFISYVMVVVCSLIFFVLQLRKAQKWTEANATHKHFAVLVSGLPKDAVESENLKTVFQDLLDSHQVAAGGANAAYFEQNDEVLRVVGVSVSYDYKEHGCLVNEAIDAWQSELAEKDKSKSAFGEPIFPFPSCSLWRCPSKEQVPARPLAELEKEIRSILPTLKGTGYGIVVLSSDKAAGALISAISSNQIESWNCRFLDFKQLRATPMQTEPLDVVWENFACENSMCCACFFAIVAAFSVLGIWCTTYLPFAVFFGRFSVTQDEAERPVIVKGVVLGTLIAIGNGLAVSAMQLICSWTKFSDKEKRDGILLALGFFTTSCNVFCNLFVVFTVRQMLEMGMQNWQNGRFTDVIVQEVTAYVLPAYLILPCVGRSMSRVVLPSLLGRSPEDFDVSGRYAEILNNFTVSLALLVFARFDSWKVAISLIIFLVLLYKSDIARLLRSNNQIFYSSTRLSDAFALWWSVPTGFLGAVAVWWAMKCGYVKLDNLVHGLGVHGLGVSQKFICAESVCTAWMFLHIIVHIAVLQGVRRCVKEPDLSKWRYHEASAALSQRGIHGSYFNTNPVFCLRSQFLHAQPCIPCAKVCNDVGPKLTNICEDL